VSAGSGDNTQKVKQIVLPGLIIGRFEKTPIVGIKRS
jgi:hypothetical protein